MSEVGEVSSIAGGEVGGEVERRRRRKAIYSTRDY